jgi:hypothetical protein
LVASLTRTATERYQERRIPDYAIYGVTVASDLPLFSLRAAPPGSPSDVVVHFQTVPAWSALDLATLRERYRTPPGANPLDTLIVSESPHGFTFCYSDGTDFWMTPDGREIWSRWPSTATLADTETYLLGPVLGFALRLRGVLCLHASAVVVDGRAIALVGGAMIGKSTTASAFGVAGYAILSDDLVTVRETLSALMVAPGHPYMKVWEASQGILFPDGRQLPRLTPTWDKRALVLDAHGLTFAEVALPLGAIVLLEPRDADATRPFVEPAERASALLSIIPETYAGYLLDADMRREEFVQLGRVLSQTPVFRAVPSDDPSRLPWLVERIVEAVGG